MVLKYANKNQLILQYDNLKKYIIDNFQHDLLLYQIKVF